MDQHDGLDKTRSEKIRQLIQSAALAARPVPLADALILSVGAKAGLAVTESELQRELHNLEHEGLIATKRHTKQSSSIWLTRKGVDVVEGMSDEAEHVDHRIVNAHTAFQALPRDHRRDLDVRELALRHGGTTQKLHSLLNLALQIDFVAQAMTSELAELAELLEVCRDLAIDANDEADDLEWAASRACSAIQSAAA
jgi:hypothetical protein